ncbi:hypothetical protein [Hungatella hathewayi]|uniref:hypothetical protein n=1 Tax=Hungatella hathewayi TaxID=154046 RepID=UPI0035633D15
MSVVGKIIKSKDRFVFYYGVSFNEGKIMVQSKTLGRITAEHERLLEIEQSANRLYGYYGQGYYKGRFASLKPVLQDIFTLDHVFYTWTLLDDWLWKLHEEAPDPEHFAFGLIQFFTGRIDVKQISRFSCRTVESQERKLKFLESSLEEMGKTEDLCIIRLMKETGIRIGDFEDITWDNIQFPYVSGVMTKKTKTLYPVSQISERTYDLLKQLHRRDEKVFHRNRSAFQATVRKAAAGEFEFAIYGIRWYWLKAVVKVEIPETSHSYAEMNTTDE